MQPTILIVDDEKLAREELHYLLKQVGDIEVLAEGSNGVEAVATWKRQPFDVIMMDMQMPEMDGFETAQALSKAYPRMRILGNSINEDEDNIIKIIQKGACGYLIKGESLQDLKYAIEF